MVGYTDALTDPSYNGQIRRKSLELGIPVLTTPEISESFVKTLEWLQTNETTKKPLQPYEN